MAEVEVESREEKDIVFKLTMNEAQYLKTVLGRFVQNVTPIQSIWDALDSAGVPVYSNVKLYSMATEPVLTLEVDTPEAEMLESDGNTDQG